MKNFVNLFVLCLFLFVPFNSIKAQDGKCVACWSDPVAGYCETHLGWFMGWNFCSCLLDQCHCETECKPILPRTLSEVVEDSDMQLPIEGLALSSVPAKEYLSSLDKVRVQGIIRDHIYMAEDFAILVYSESNVKIFPLVDGEKVEVRDCRGNFVERGYRATDLKDSYRVSIH